MKRHAYNEMYLQEDNHWWFVARRKIIQNILRKYANKADIRNVLEIGCGSGGNLKLLSEYGHLEAMEMDDTARQSANQRNICTVSSGSLPSNLPYNNQFDLICVFDVIEHIDDDIQSVKSIENLLAPGGVLLATVPAYQFLWSAHDVANDHKRRYTRTSLRNLFQNTRLNTVYSSYFNSFLFPAVLMARLLNNLSGKEEEFDVKMPSTIVNTLLMNIFAAERIFIPHISLPFGVSLVLVARKPR